MFRVWYETVWSTHSLSWSQQSHLGDVASPTSSAENSSELNSSWDLNLPSRQEHAISLPRPKETRKGNLYFLFVKINLFLKLSTYRITKVHKVHLAPPVPFSQGHSFLVYSPSYTVVVWRSGHWCCWELVEPSRRTLGHWKSDLDLWKSSHWFSFLATIWRAPSSSTHSLHVCCSATDMETMEPSDCGWNPCNSGTEWPFLFINSLPQVSVTGKGICLSMYAHKLRAVNAPTGFYTVSVLA